MVKKVTSVQISKKTHTTLRLLGKMFKTDTIDETISELIKYITIEQDTKITIKNKKGKVIDTFFDNINTANIETD